MIPAIQLHPWSDIQSIKPKKYLVKGLLDQGGLSMIYGQSNSGKTFFAIDIAACISLGFEWRDAKVIKGKVAYLALEGGSGAARRLIAFHQHNALGNNYGDLHLGLQSILFAGEGNDCNLLIDKIKSMEDVSLVIVDTLARAMGGANENSPDDMGSFIQSCDKIREETGAHVMVIHHSGKDNEKGARGHSSLRAAVDTEIKVWQKNGIITAEVTKQRDGAIGDQFSFELKPVNIGIDEDGDPITSCVLVPTEAAPEKKKRKLTPQARRALDILNNCLIDKGEIRHVRANMASVNCVTILEYRDYLKREKISSSDKPASENTAITRAIDALNDERITVSYGKYIWLADKQDKTDESEQMSSSET